MILLLRLASTPGRIAETVSGVGDLAARWGSRPPQRSLVENVAHLRDVELEATTPARIRRILTEENPTLEGFDSASVIAAERYNEDSLIDAPCAFELGRRRNVARLETPSESELSRAATIGRRVVPLHEGS